ncbi:unnamed protein product, partial [Musa banksii]
PKLIETSRIRFSRPRSTRLLRRERSDGSRPHRGPPAGVYRGADRPRRGRLDQNIRPRA